jgi:uncharacterized membrane protein
MCDERAACRLAAACLVVAAAGLAVSIYLTAVHYTSPEVLACSASGIIDCDAVTTSSQSVLLGIPVTVLGIAFFVGMLVMNLPTLWRSDSPTLRWGRFGAVAAGMVFVLWLIYVEIHLVHAICLWCTVVHALTFALFCLVLWGTVGLTPGSNETEAGDESD